MATDQEYALLAYTSYNSGFANRLNPLDSGWTKIVVAGSDDAGSGFSASVYQKGSEYVVSFRGSGPVLQNELITPDWQNNVAAVDGLRSQQVSMALRLVAQLQENGVSLANISFTGHSLGGGLADVMGVFFNRPAVTFATAPFERAATTYLGLGPFQSVSEYYDEYIGHLQGIAGSATPAPAFTSYRDAWNGLPGDGIAMFHARELAQTRDAYVTGDPVAATAAFRPAIAGSRTELVTGNQTVSLGSSTRHDMRLVALLNASPTVLSNAFVAHESLLELISSDALYGTDRSNGVNKSFYIDLLQDFYSTNPVFKGVINRFAEDLSLRLGSTGALAQSSNGKTLERGIIATLIEYYYYKDGTAANFLTQVANGVQFDLSQIPTWNPPGPAAPLMADSRAGRGVLELVLSLPNLSDAQHQAVAQAAAWATPLWTVQSGGNGLITAGAAASEVQVGAPGAMNFLTGGGGDDVIFGGNSGNALQGDAGFDKLFGGVGVDSLVGGADDDYLVGAAGADTLIGGTGNDLSYGGAGSDQYLFLSGDGVDTIEDSDGIGLIRFNGTTVSAGAAIATNLWRASAPTLNDLTRGVERVAGHVHRDDQ
jgi:hypothetical protein